MNRLHSHDTPKPILVHLNELKRRLIRSILTSIIMSIPAFYFYESIISILKKPFISEHGLQDTLIITSIFEGFTTRLSFAIIFGIILSSPIHLYHMIRFIFPGLKRKEKRVISICLFFGSLLAIGGLYMVYVIILPLSIRFLTSTQFIPSDVEIYLHFNQNIFYIFNFLLAGIAIFQLPLILEVLMYLNVVKRQTLWKNSRLAIILIAILSALITPPDLMSQLSIALPLIVLYFLTIVIAKLFKFGEES